MSHFEEVRADWARGVDKLKDFHENLNEAIMLTEAMRLFQKALEGANMERRYADVTPILNGPQELIDNELKALIDKLTAIIKVADDIQSTL